jgi:hypothetical protein
VGVARVAVEMLFDRFGEDTKLGPFTQAVVNGQQIINGIHKLHIALKSNRKI